MRQENVENFVEPGYSRQLLGKDSKEIHESEESFEYENFYSDRKEKLAPTTNFFTKRFASIFLGIISIICIGYAYYVLQLAAMMLSTFDDTEASRNVIGGLIFCFLTFIVFIILANVFFYKKVDPSNDR